MYSFNVDLIDGLNGTEELSNTPIDGIPSCSSLDILINCLQGDFVHALTIRHYPDKKFQFPTPSDDEFPKSLQEHMEQKEQKKLKKEFFEICSQGIPCLTKAVPTGSEKEINDAQFHTLCDAIKKSRNLKTLWLLSTLPFTEYQEQELVATVAENPSITLVIINGYISPGTINALEAITKQRAELNIVSRDAVTSTNNIQEAIQHQLLKETHHKTPCITNMHLLQGFIAILGAAAVATAFVLLHAAVLNPLGSFILAAAGGAALGSSAYSFFTSRSSKPPENIKLNVLAASM